MRTLILLLMLSPLMCLAQSFEGTITYSNSFKSKSPSLKDEQLATMMGTKQEYSIKGGNYKSIFNGTFVKMQLYKNIENRSYTLTGKSDTLYWENYGVNKDAAIKYEVRNSNEKIMGLPCDLLIVQTPKSKTYYYYNKKYGINPELFKRQAYGNWYYIISKTKALPLKTVYENDLFVLTSTAVKISPVKLQISSFELPYKKKVAAANW